MIASVIVSLVLLSGLLVFVGFRFGVITSLSSLCYILPHRWIFPLVLGVSTVMITAPMFEVTPDDYRFLVFLTIAGALFVAASPLYHEGLDKPIHYTSAVILSAATVVWIILLGYIPYIGVVGAVIGLANRQNIVYWFEVGILCNLYYVLISQLV